MRYVAQEEIAVTTTQVYDGQIIKVSVSAVQLGNGAIVDREIVSHPSSVCIVAIGADSRVILVRQYRKAVEASLLEVPAGKMEGNEAPTEAAQRELREEIGHTAGSLVPLAGFYTAPSFCTQYMHCYLATDLIRDPLSPDDDEFIAPVRVPLPDIPQLITGGVIRDAKSISALLLAMRVMGDN